MKLAGRTFMGTIAIVSHSSGLATFYAHCDSIAVPEGAVLRQGELIGYVGIHRMVYRPASALGNPDKRLAGGSSLDIWDPAGGTAGG